MEPDVAMLFKKNDMEDIDLGVIESNLRRAIEEVSKWLQIVLQKWLIPYGPLNPIGKLIIGSVEQFLIDHRIWFCFFVGHSLNQSDLKVKPTQLDDLCFPVLQSLCPFLL